MRLADPATVQWLRATFSPDGRCDGEHEAAGDLGYGWVQYGYVRWLRPQRVLAIGSRTGFIPACLGMAVSDNGHGHLDFVDANYTRGVDVGAMDGIGWWSTHTFDALDPVVTIHRQRTDAFFPTCAHTYGYISIDGGHDYATAKYDTDESAKRLAPGGVMALHDWCWPDRTFGVKRVVDELVAAGWRALYLQGVAGLAIVQRGVA